MSWRVLGLGDECTYVGFVCDTECAVHGLLKAHGGPLEGVLPKSGVSLGR